MIRTTERERQRLKQAQKASAERDITISPPADLKRRHACLQDPFEFLPTYFGHIFYQPFTADRREMTQAILHAARYSGDFCLAGPRGSGKSKVALFVALYLILNQWLRLPLLIGKNQKGSENELTNLKRELTGNPLLAADFPEVCQPLIALDGWASRALKQTVNGDRTDILWAQDCVLLPTIREGALGRGWPTSVRSLATGNGVAVVGVDGRIRGFNRRNMRPDFALIDDVDDRESARSTLQTADLVTAIEQDIAGLGGSGQRCSRVMLCTVINRQCIAYKYSDRTKLPGWRGKRFKSLVKLPDREDLWAEYIELRRNRDPDTDPDARVAHRYYLANRAAMDAGAELGNPYAFESKPAADGEPLEVSALQSCYNKISDTSWDAFCTEFQNSPPATDEVSKAGISKQLIQSRLSGFSRGELPPDCALVIGIDPGKTFAHFDVCAVRKGAIVNLVQYGVIEIQGTERTEQREVIERAILRGLIDWKDQLAANPFRDADGNPVEPDVVLIDSGYCPDAVAEFVRLFGEPFRATKGSSNFHHGKPDRTRRVGHHWFAQKQPNGGWLYSIDADYWKRQVHERFITEPMDENNRPRQGSLTLFVPAGKRDHQTYASHVLAEEFVMEFIPGKGEKSYWLKHSSNNHHLDATALCLCGAEMTGNGLFPAAQARRAYTLAELQQMASGRPTARELAKQANR